MRLLVTCPDCEDNAPLHEIVAITEEDEAKTTIDTGDLLGAPGNDETWGWCPRCERTWNVTVKYDEVLSRTSAKND
jgi:hypothetical protein